MNKISCIMGKEPLLHVHTAKGQASLSFHAGSPEPMLLAHISGRPKGNLAKKLDVASIRGQACALKG